MNKKHLHIHPLASIIQGLMHVYPESYPILLPSIAIHFPERETTLSQALWVCSYNGKLFIPVATGYRHQSGPLSTSTASQCFSFTNLYKEHYSVMVYLHILSNHTLVWFCSAGSLVEESINWFLPLRNTDNTHRHTHSHAWRAHICFSVHLYAKQGITDWAVCQRSLCCYIFCVCSLWCSYFRQKKLGLTLLSRHKCMPHPHVEEKLALYKK